MSDPVLSQLVSVESDLSEQMEALENRLQQIREQRSGLRTVIDMFQDSDDPGDSSSTSVSKSKESTPSTDTTAQAEQAESEKPAKRSVGRPRGSKNKNKASKSKTKAKRKPGRPKGSGSSGAKKKDGRSADWQKYVQSDFSEIALPEAVSGVLQSKSSEVFKIADVMNAIFIEDMPRDQYLKARNRISNILSAGARDGSWHRGRNGRYSLSASAAKG